MAATAILKNLEKSPYLSKGFTDRHETWHDGTMMQIDPLTLTTLKIPPF